jgi:hypothetical protein
MTITGDYPVVRVHVSGSDVPMGGAPAKRCRRPMKTNTFTLTAANPVQRVFPRSDTRVEGWVTGAVAASSPPIVYIAANQADANSQSGGAAQISGLDTTPFPVNTTDEVWISAPSVSLPVTVSTVAIYEEPD